jgi:hypothetical protein
MTFEYRSVHVRKIITRSWSRTPLSAAAIAKPETTTAATLAHAIHWVVFIGSPSPPCLRPDNHHP